VRSSRRECNRSTASGLLEGPLECRTSNGLRPAKLGGDGDRRNDSDGNVLRLDVYGDWATGIDDRIWKAERIGVNRNSIDTGYFEEAWAGCRDYATKWK
jgi:hypothetical protein